MEAAYTYYDFEKSIERITEILDSSDSSYEDKKSIPARDCLTFNNGYYVSVSVLFVDLRGSTDLSEKHTQPVLAKIYRAYISEIVAVIKGHSNVSEIYSEGDGLWAVFDTPYKNQIDGVFSTAAQVASLIDILNIKLEKKGYSTIRIGIGLDYGESLYIKAGYKNSGINEVVWIGKVVGSAAHLCKNGNRNWSDEKLMVSEIFYDNLNDHNKGLLSWNSARSCYHGNICNGPMNEWVNDNG